MPLDLERWPRRAPYLVAAGWFAPATLAVLNAYAQARLDHRPPLSAREYLWSGGDWLLYAFLTPFVFALARRFPLRRPRFARHLTVQLLFSLAFCGAWSGAGDLLRWLLFPAVRPGWAQAAGWFFTTLPFGVAVYFAMAGVAQGIDTFTEARRRETEAARLTAQLAEARLGALRMQLHPHFLLNSLNALGVLLRDGDSGAAAAMLEQLGELLHRVLASTTRPECRLDEELEFIRMYLAIEQVRFSDRLRVEFRIEPGLASSIVPALVLQPLVENALRHGIASRAAAGRVTITARRESAALVLTVTDDGAGPPSNWNEGVGVRISRARGEFSLRREGDVTIAEIRMSR